MKRNYLLISIAVVLVILVLIKVFRQSHDAKGTAAKAAVAAIPAECYLARDTIINFPIKTIGYIRSNEQVDIVAEISRRVTGIAFQEGGMVKKGDVLFRLDDAELKAELKKVTAKLDLARDNEKRNKRLLESGGISQQAYDESLNTMKVLESEAEYIQVQIDKTVIRAPFSGKTGLRNVSEGAFLNPGMVLTSIEDISRLKLDFSIPENSAASVKTGDALTFIIEGLKGDHAAVVEAVDPSVDKTSGNLRIRALIQNPGSGLVPGVSASVSIRLKSSGPCLFIPTQSLIPSPAGYSVYKMEKGVAKLQKVKTGLRSDTQVEVTEGLNTGDSILITALLKVRPDSRVSIIKTW